MKRSLICFEEFNEFYHKRPNYISFTKIGTKFKLKKH